jgi:3'-5' exoribonuclease
MTHQLIVDLKEGVQVQQYFLVRQVEEAITKDGNPYLKLVLADRSGSLPAKLWSNVLQEFPGPFQVGDYVGAVGLVQAFQGSLQLKIQRMLTTEQILALKGELKDFDASLLHAASEYDPEQMWQELLSLVDEFLDPPLRDLVANLLHRHAEVWRLHPAARQNHHAYLGGLLEHTWFVARLALQAAGLYPDINRQLVVAGAILHDLGKLKELSQPYAPEYTIPGQLLGHIVLGWEMIRQEAARMNFADQNLLLQLEHIIITHHGQRDFGSPVLPKTREAMVVYFADDLDSKLKIMEQHLKADTSNRNFTPYLRLLQRELYKCNLEPESQLQEEASMEE